MKSICINLHVHQPFRFRKYRFFDIGNDHYYYNDFANEHTMQKAAELTYLPANNCLLEIIEKHQGDFKVSFNITGLAIEQFELFAPEVLKSFKELAKTGQVEFVASPYSYSLSSLMDEKLFKREVEKHTQLIQFHFGQTPKVLCNTENIISDDIIMMAKDMGFEAMLTEGAKHVLGWKSPNYLYSSIVDPNMKLLMRNFQLCDDLSFRFSNHQWSEFPLTADKYVSWIHGNPKEELVNIFLGYDVFGGMQSAQTGIFEFMKAMPDLVCKHKHLEFITPSEAAKKLKAKPPISIVPPISWSGEARDLSAYMGNEMQNEALEKLHELADRMMQVSDRALNEDWNRIQACNHFYLMGKGFYTKMNPHLDRHSFDSPYEAFINYMNILSDFELRLNDFVPNSKREEEIDFLTSLLVEKEANLQKYKAQIERLKKKQKNLK